MLTDMHPSLALSPSQNMNSVAGPSRIGIDHPLTSFAMSIGSARGSFYPGCSPGTLMGPLDLPDLKITTDENNATSAFSLPSGSWRAMLGSVPKADATICRDYTCCGLQLTDLHALVEHFEECHVVVMDEPTAFIPPAHMTISPQATVSVPVTQPQKNTGSSSQPIDVDTPHPVDHESPTIDIDTMDEMDIDMDGSAHSSASVSGSGSGSPSPPLTPVLPFDTTPVQARRPTIPLLAQVSVSRPASPRGIMGSVTEIQPDLERAFNRYAGYTEFSSMLPGTEGAGANFSAAGTFGAAAMRQAQSSKLMNGGLAPSFKNCLPPSLLSSSASTTPVSTRASSPNTSPRQAPIQPRLRIPPLGSGTQSLTSSPSSSVPPTPTGSGTSAFFLSKPFRCPKPGCNKAYKQANGLKYHLQHGSCNFAPRDESLDALSERELEEKLKPFKCGVGPCERRYKNMNGLRYHYQHSGAHGAIGLALLASGAHDGVNVANAQLGHGHGHAHAHGQQSHHHHLQAQRKHSA